MNLVLLEPDDFGAEGRACLSGRRLAHVREIQRAKVGDTLRVGVLNGRMGRARVVRIDVDLLELEVSLESDPPPPAPVTLVLALPRPLILKRALHAATALGVKRIVLLHTRRVEKTFWDATAMSDEALRLQLLLGLEQARDTVVPELLVRRRFRPFVEDELPGWLEAGVTGYLAHPGQGEACPPVVDAPCVMAIGPEGGLLDGEVERFEAAGMRRVELGKRILRVDAALPFFLSRVPMPGAPALAKSALRS